MSVRDISIGETIDIKFTTRAFATGIPTTAASLAVAAYPGNSTTEITAGITTTFTSGFDARAGLVNVRIVATTGNGYATATDYTLVVTAGTVDSVSIVGEVVGEFTIGRSAAATRVGILTATAATGDPGTTVTAIAYLKQLVNILTGTAGITTFPAEAAPGNAVSLAEVIRAIHADVTGIAGAAMRGTDSAALASVCTETRLSELDAGTAGKAANQIDIIQTDTTTDIPAQISALNNISTAQVNAEVVDVINTDTSGEPGQGAPAATTSLREKIDYLYKAWRNRKRQTATTWELMDDAETTVDQKATVSDDGTTAIKQEIVSGP